MTTARASRIYRTALILFTIIGLNAATSVLAQGAPQLKPGKVLVVLSAANSIPLMEGGTHPTGIFLGELTEPAEAMAQAGYQLVFTSPGGRAPTIDSDSLRYVYWGQSKKRLEHAKGFYTKLVEAGLNSPIPFDPTRQVEDRQIPLYLRLQCFS